MYFTDCFMAMYFPDGEALSHAVTAVLDKGAEIIRLAEKERRKYEDG